MYLNFAQHLNFSHVYSQVIPKESRRDSPNYNQYMLPAIWLRNINWNYFTAIVSKHIFFTPQIFIIWSEEFMILENAFLMSRRFFWHQHKHVSFLAHLSILRAKMTKMTVKIEWWPTKINGCMGVKRSIWTSGKTLYALKTP